MRSLPDFIIAGAPKCGTTALYYFLTQHTDVFMTANKEPRFFTSIKGDMEKEISGNGPRLSGNYNKGFKWYNSLFENATEFQKTGEASTVYFANEDAAQLIYSSVPCIKLIFMLRHPVKRIYSHYWQEFKLGFNFPSFMEMIKNDHVRMQYYKRVSHYKLHLERYFNLFKKDQILILIQEEFENNPKFYFDKVLDFLQVQTMDLDLSLRANKQVAPKNRMLANILNFVKNSKSKEYLPAGLKKPLNIMRKKILKKNIVAFEYKPLDVNLLKLIEPEYYDDVAYVENILGRKIPFWNY